MIEKEELLKKLAELPKLPDGNIEISLDFLNDHKDDVIFVFGDNTEGVGLGGQAKIARKVSNSYGFITKIYPSHSPGSYYSISNYIPVFERELQFLKDALDRNKKVWYLIPTLGNGLANKFHIWENVIRDRIKPELSSYSNVIFLY